MRDWLLAFTFTQAVEVPLYLIALTLCARRLRPPWQRLAVAFGASALTHPFVWFVMPRAWPGSYEGMVAAAETVAVVTEALYLDLLGLRGALWWSLLANGCSLGLGLVYREVLGWP